MHSEFLARALYRLRGRVVRLYPQTKKKGSVLLSYTTEPFFKDQNDPLLGHTRYFEARQMAREFLARGYAVDVIDERSTAFVPKKTYDYFIDVHGMMEKLAPYMDASCTKILHITTAHWKVQNKAAQRRSEDLQKRRGIALAPERQLAPSYDIEACDLASTIAGDFATESYRYAGKEITRLPLSTTHTYPSPEAKDVAAVRNSFIWFGGAGALHKGLDLVLEVFAAHPEWKLTVMGKVGKEFTGAFRRELYELPNITTIGWIDPGSEAFKVACDGALGIVYPSCSEGCASSVVLAMHAGLVPIVSFETGVETKEFGVQLPTSSIADITQAITSLEKENTDTLRTRAMGVWQYAREHHTREKFSESYHAFIDILESKKV